MSLELSAASPTPDLPEWCVEYIGIPFDPNGRSVDGADCWGLTRMVYQNEFNIELPIFNGVQYTDSFDDSQLSELEKYVVREKLEWQRRGVFNEVPLGEAMEGDIIILFTYGHPIHMGIVLGGGYMLSTREGVDASIESYRHPLWKSRIDGVYRHVSRA